ncbi:hemerythrin domain-containing protein [Streptomyces sp. NPDC057271]|uniref:hemerythrin domain-containing protein n=1 Tax=unclassified Streptomyces TaxID=2593676 RepID=UPI00362CAA3A
MDGIVLLRADHKTVERLFKEYEKAGDTEHRRKREISDEVVRELTTHARIEERVLYPAAREAAPDAKDHVLESVELGEKMEAAKKEAPSDPLAVPSA